MIVILYFVIAYLLIGILLNILVIYYIKKNKLKPKNSLLSYLYILLFWLPIVLGYNIQFEYKIKEFWKKHICDFAPDDMNI